MKFHLHLYSHGPEHNFAGYDKPYHCVAHGNKIPGVFPPTAFWVNPCLPKPM